MKFFCLWEIANDKIVFCELVARMQYRKKDIHKEEKEQKFKAKHWNACAGVLWAISMPISFAKPDSSQNVIICNTGQPLKPSAPSPGTLLHPSLWLATGVPAWDTLATGSGRWWAHIVRDLKGLNGQAGKGLPFWPVNIETFRGNFFFLESSSKCVDAREKLWVPIVVLLPVLKTIDLL